MAEPKPIELTDYKDLGRLYTSVKQNRNPARSEPRPVNAIDTETYEGDIFLIADSDSRYLDDISADSVFDFLFCKKFENAWNFCYNLTYDAEVILKLLGKSLFSYKKAKRLSFKHGDYSINYIPTKQFRISKGHHSCSFFDIAQFFGNHGLAKDYEKNIGKLDSDYIEMKDRRKEFSPSLYKKYSKKIRDYCIQDCVYTKQLAEKWINLFNDAFGLYTQRWTSAGYLAEKVIINNNIFFPKFEYINYDIQDLAYSAYFGGRFEILKRGFIGYGALYDINSAYPHAIRHIPDLTDGKWIKSKSIHPDAKLGFFHIRANIPETKYVPPFPFRANNRLAFPCGVFETYVTLDELKACESPDFYKIIKSYQYIPRTEHLPYKEFIEKMYEKRLELKQQNNPLQMPVKIVLNSIYGKTGQKTQRRIGNIFNPVIFSFITGFARAQLYRFVMKNNLERNVVAFATDSICFNKKIDMNSTVLGEFSFDMEANDVFYVQNGIYRFNEMWKKRGLGNLNGKEIEHLDTIEKNGDLYLKYVEPRTTRLRTAIIENRIADIGKIKPKTKKIDINGDRKRFWPQDLLGLDVDKTNESEPLSLSHILKSQI